MQLGTCIGLALVLSLVAWEAHAADGGLEGLDEPPAPAPAPFTHTTTPHAAHTQHNAAPQAAAAPSPAGGMFSVLSGELGKLGQAKFGPAKFGPLEAVCAAALALCLAVMATGRRANSTLANAWAAAYAAPDGLLDKQFAHVHQGDGNRLMREAGNCYKLYASGRRHVEGLLVTLSLRARQDILSLLWYVISPTEDTVTMEAYMTEASTPQVVVAVGTPKVVRKMANNHMDLLKYTRRIQVPKEQLPGWPADKLHVYAEHSIVFSDLFNEARLLAVFSPTGPNAAALKYFRSLHITNEFTEGSATHSRVVRLTLALPPVHQMEDLAPLMALMPLLIDLVGSYKLSSDMRKKLESGRLKAAEEATRATDVKQARLEALQQRKQEKLLSDKAKLMRLSPEERQRAEEKLRKKEMDRAMRKRMVKG